MNADDAIERGLMTLSPWNLDSTTSPSYGFQLVNPRLCAAADMPITNKVRFCTKSIVNIYITPQLQAGKTGKLKEVCAAIARFITQAPEAADRLAKRIDLLLVIARGLWGLVDVDTYGDYYPELDILQGNVGAKDRSAKLKAKDPLVTGLYRFFAVSPWKEELTEMVRLANPEVISSGSDSGSDMGCLSLLSKEAAASHDDHVVMQLSRSWDATPAEHPHGKSREYKK